MFAVLAWRNSMVFHSVDKVTSMFIHVSPTFGKWSRSYDRLLQLDIESPIQSRSTSSVIWLTLFSHVEFTLVWGQSIQYLHFRWKFFDFFWYGSIATDTLLSLASTYYYSKEDLLTKHIACVLYQSANIGQVQVQSESTVYDKFPVSYKGKELLHVRFYWYNLHIYLGTLL
jgi:hypothetical protein